MLSPERATERTREVQQNLARRRRAFFSKRRLLSYAMSPCDPAFFHSTTQALSRLARLAAVNDYEMRNMTGAHPMLRKSASVTYPPLALRIEAHF